MADDAGLMWFALVTAACCTALPILILFFLSD